MIKVLAFIKGIFRWVFSSKIKAGIVIALILVGGFLGYRNFSQKNQQPTFQTAQAEKGSLVTAVSASGNITSANNVAVTIQAAGVVKEVFVKNGDKVSQGQTIATLTLDQASQQKQAAALASYLSAKSSLDSANAKFNSLQSAEFKANQKLINDAVARTLTTTDPTYIQENADWLQAEADYKNQQGALSAAKASMASASLTLSQTSSTITAPAPGVIKGLTITPGSIVTVTSSSANSTSTSQVLGSINQEGPTQSQVNISEVDSVNVSEGQKVTMTLDAFPNSTFTGKVVSINTNGVVSSNVTTYPAVITFDSGNDHIYPNMAVSAKIITSVKNDVILVPSAAVTTSNGQSMARVLKNNKPQSVDVEVGDSNDTQTEIKSGINEGDNVVTGTTSGNSGTRTTGTTSPFGAFGGRGFGGGGGGGIRRGD